MAKIKYTKNELKKQKDDLKRFRRYLPTLILKKQQLQLEIIKVRHELERLQKEIEKTIEGIYQWVAVFGEDVGIKELIKVKNIHTKTDNIAGIDIPILERIEFSEKEYDMLDTPLWVDFGLEALKEIITLKARHQIVKKQVELLAEELRITTQRVNLFEKIKIPQAQEHIRCINIVLGDMQTAAVVTGKIAKKKIEIKELAMV